MRIKSLAILAVLCVAAFGEVVARVWLGLGTPPLSVPHPTIEYMFRPNQDVYRFHKRQIYNEYGMRSPPLACENHDRIILAFGDSVLNGGALTDHAMLATNLASARMSTSGTRVYVGNVSAGSWGPGNIRAWIDAYGFKCADTAIFVLSSHDIDDQPSYEPLRPDTHPTVAPISAVVEGISRYLPRYLPGSLARVLTPQPVPMDRPTGPVPTGQQDLSGILDRSAAANIKVCLVQHLTRAEVRSGVTDKGFTDIASIFAARNVPSVNLGASVDAALREGKSVYRDDIHINDEGQALLASALVDCAKIATVPTR